jgi:hypothetical protein
MAWNRHPPGWAKFSNFRPWSSWPLTGVGPVLWITAFNFRYGEFDYVSRLIVRFGLRFQLESHPGAVAAARWSPSSTDFAHAFSGLQVLDIPGVAMQVVAGFLPLCLAPTPSTNPKKLHRPDLEP